eukprot:4687666-Pleurochrysis_carterae.AAC.2
MLSVRQTPGANASLELEPQTSLALRAVEPRDGARANRQLALEGVCIRFRREEVATRLCDVSGRMREQEACQSAG